MAEKGILEDDDPVELLEGIIVEKMPKNPPHRRQHGLLARFGTSTPRSQLHLPAANPDRMCL